MKLNCSATKLMSALIAVFCLSAEVGVASAASIGVFSTGASVTAGLDNNYQIIADTTGEASTPLPTPAVLITTLNPHWAPAVAGSSWVGPQANESFAATPNGCCNGSDTYQTTFSLAGLNPGTAILNIVMSADDDANVWLNGIEVYVTGQENYNPGNTVLTINKPADFLSGVNTLDFVVANYTGATGLDVAISGTASLNSVPEPDSRGMLLGLGILAAAFGLRKKQLAPGRQSR